MPTSSGRRSGVSSSPNAHRTSVPAALSLAKILVLGVTRLPLLRAAPASLREVVTVDGGEEPKSASDPGLWLYLTFAVILVLLGGIFAGLTIALMGQDDVNLQVIHASGDGSEKHHAGSVLRLLKRGKHWVLVTLLLGNVITNETLPIVLDRSLGGGWPAVLSSTALIVIFGEIIPQSICVRYGLRIGAWMSPLVLVLMYVLAPVAWPTAKLLDRMLGEDHGTIYKKAGLKTLVTLHRTLGTSASERLNQDEVTIISAVLDLKDKSVGSIMTPMEDVFTLSADTVLDEKMMENVLSAGYSRIPIHEPENPSNFLGMLLVKTLITYDPEDAERVGNFALATLPETRPETCCLDIVNFFQEGKSHMVLVSDRPGQDHGAIGVVTLEDVIEELIGEEIIDESDVYIDVHRAVRRKDVAPGIQIAEIHAGSRKKHQDNDTEDTATDRSQDEDESRDADQGEDKGRPPLQKMETGASFKSDDAVKAHAKNMRSTREGNLNRGSLSDLRGQSKFGPSNLASQPRQTRYTTVVIKDAKDAKDTKDAKDGGRRRSEDANRTQSEVSAGGRSGTTPSYTAGRQMRDAFRSFRSGYGSFLHARSSEASGTSNKGLKATVNPSMSQDSAAAPDQTDASTPQVEVTLQGRQGSHSTLNSLPGGDGDGADRSFLRPRRVTKSGSITENVVETGGVRKVVLELTSGSEDSDTVSNSPADEATAAGGDGRGRDDGADGGSYGTTNGGEAEESTTQDASAGGKKKNKNRRRKRRNDNNSNSNGNGGPSASGDAREDEPLLGSRED